MIKADKRLDALDLVDMSAPNFYLDNFMLLRQIVAALEPAISQAETWIGHRAWFVDGAGVSVPNTPSLQREFGQPTNQAPDCGFTVAHVLALFHAGSELLQSHLVLLYPARALRN